MRSISIFLISFIVLICSCHKEVTTNPEIYPENAGNTIAIHYAYFKGVITDSLTGTPISGYKVCHQHVTSFPNCDALVNGIYKLSTRRLTGQFNVGFPETVNINLINSADSIVKTVTFDGALLVEGDTIIVNFQVTL